MNYVIDFIGFYIDDRLRIEEFCECRVSKKGVEVRNPMLFAIDPDDVSSYGTSQNGNQEYNQKFGIGVASPRYLVSTLINYINELLSTNEKIFVRNHEKIQQLKDFMNMPMNYNNNGKKSSNMKFVIDFSGFNFNRRFIVRELSVCRIDTTLIVVRRFVIAIPPHIASQYRRTSNYQQFRDKYGVKDHLDAAIDFEEFQESFTIKDFIQDSNVLYLRNWEQFEQLISFCPIVQLYRNKVKLLTNIGFDDTNEVLQTFCSYHQSHRNYCANDNAQLMGSWIINRKLRKLNSRKNMQLVVNFTGFCDTNNSFKVKEFSVLGINNQGNIVYKKLFVVKLVLDSKNINTAAIANYKNYYYNHFGIHYLHGNYEENRFLNKIRKLFKDYDVNIVYVNAHNQSYFLNYLIPDLSIEVISLSDYNYVEELNNSNLTCVYHTHNVRSKNVCAALKGWQMTFWILGNKFYKPEVRNRGKNASDAINIDSRCYIHDDTVRQYIIDGLDELPDIDINDLEM
ncbi:hypothetical protein KQX54_015288 [Cotesia glomerata]|uniref:Uncharacterized protein n=1 Tax=Cotesia glomerata TaxID=32391 RepID=A0AAV7IM75_COTGL|nr:hypothetical protein KQX54_015288 [Cotesia glomerata]